jgi:hypothetical protein
VVFGGTRRDRNLRLHFDAGDFLYSIGRKEGVGLTEKMNLRLEGLWASDGHFQGARPTREHKFASPANSFELELRIDGPRAEVWIDGVREIGWATTDGQPIEGWIGFAMGQGAVRVQEPTVARRDGFVPPAVLDVTAKGTVEFAECLHRPLRGVPVGPDGTIVVVAPDDEDFALPRIRAAMPGLRPALEDALAFPQKWCVLAPAALPQAGKPIAAEFEPYAKDRLHTGTHAWTLGHRDVWVLFVDGGGILRAAQRQVSKTRLGGLVEDWARKYRGG